MRLWAYLFLGLFLSFLLMGSQAQPQPDQILLETAKKLGIGVNTIVYHHGGRTSSWIPTSQVDLLVSQIANELHLSPIKKQKDGRRLYYRAHKKQPNLITELHVVNDQFTEIWSKPYISIQMIKDGESTGQTFPVYQRLKQILIKYRVSPKIHCTIRGSKPYRNEPLTHPVDQMFQILQAKEVEAIQTEQMVSISALSSKLPKGLNTRGGLMNVQAATKVDRITNQLLFTIGSPIITIEY